MPTKVIMIAILLVIVFAAGIGLVIYSGLSPEKTLAGIHSAYQGYDFTSFLNVPGEQTSECLIWAFGKDWNEIKWYCRADRFRDLHPELDANDFADSTEIYLFWRRVGKAYLKSKGKDFCSLEDDTNDIKEAIKLAEELRSDENSNF